MHGNELFEIAKTNNEMMAKPFWRHYDINNLTSRLWKGEGGGGMALEIVTGGKNDKTEKNYKEYLHKRTQSGTCVLFCVLPFDNKYILSCAVSTVGANAHWTKAM